MRSRTPPAAAVPEFAVCLNSSVAEVPPREYCVLRPVLARQARENGERVFAVFEDGSRWTFAETLVQAESTAAALAARGVTAGNRVLVWLPNGADCLRLWFAVNWLGGVYVPINTALKGAVLAHVIESSAARLLVTTAALTSRLAEIPLATLERVVVLSGEAHTTPGKVTTEWNSLRNPLEPVPEPAPPTQPWDEQSILFTSGTTGPSKGVLSSYCHLATAAAAAFEDKLHADIRYLVQLPLFHAGATIGVYAMLLCGGSIAVVSGFDTSTFWRTVRDLRATCATILGTMASYLLKQPPHSTDTESGIRWCFVVPLVGENRRFSERFGLDVYTQFNMSELSCPIVSEANPSLANSCGRIRPGVEARIVDAHDRPVATGQVGELCVRAERPWALSHGYNRMPEATAAAWRNGWFHTGDALREDAAGNYYFVDRLKDTVRRRGENISSLEVEAELLAYPGVLEAAVVGIPSPDGEEEVMAVLAPAPNARIDPAALIEFLRPRLAHFMIPRYFRIQDVLPKTQTGKVQKSTLRDARLAAAAWDREAHGIHIKRDQLRE